MSNFIHSSILSSNGKNPSDANTNSHLFISKSIFLRYFSAFLPAIFIQSTLFCCPAPTAITLLSYEIDTLKEGLRDTVKAIAEEMDLKPGVLNKAIRVAHKASFQDEFDKFDELETILETVGRTL